jgi:hypothetical protein
MFNRPNPSSASIRKHTNKDYWPEERQGYADVRRIAYAPVKATPWPKQRRRLAIDTQERLSMLIVVAGMIAAAHAAISNFSGNWDWHLFPPGALGICAIGALIWLHAKWRRLVKLS